MLTEYLMSVKLMNAASTSDIPNPDGSVHGSTDQSAEIHINAQHSIHVALKQTYHSNERLRMDIIPRKSFSDN